MSRFTLSLWMVACLLALCAAPSRAQEGSIDVTVRLAGETDARAEVTARLADGSMAAHQSVSSGQTATLRVKLGFPVVVHIESLGFSPVDLPRVTLDERRPRWQTTVDLQPLPLVVIGAPEGTRVRLDGRDLGAVDASRIMLLSPPTIKIGRPAVLDLRRAGRARTVRFVPRAGTGKVLFDLAAMPDRGISIPSRDYWIEPPRPPIKPRASAARRSISQSSGGSSHGTSW